MPKPIRKTQNAANQPLAGVRNRDRFYTTAVMQYRPRGLCQNHVKVLNDFTDEEVVILISARGRKMAFDDIANYFTDKSGFDCCAKFVEYQEANGRSPETGLSSWQAELLELIVRGRDEGMSFEDIRELFKITFGTASISHHYQMERNGRIAELEYQRQQEGSSESEEEADKKPSARGGGRVKNDWTSEDLERLRKLVGTKSVKKLEEDFPDKDHKSIRYQVAKHQKQHPVQKFWTREKIDLLMELIKKKTVKAIQEEDFPEQSVEQIKYQLKKERKRIEEDRVAKGERE